MSTWIHTSTRCQCHCLIFVQGHSDLYFQINSQAAGHKVKLHVGRVKRIWYLSPMQAAKVQASLSIRAVSPEPPLLAHTSSESRGTFNQKARSLVPVNGWACAVKICHDGMLDNTDSLDAAHVEPIWSVGTKVCSNDDGYCHKLLPCLYVVKSLKSFYSGAITFGWPLICLQKVQICYQQKAWNVD